MGLEHGAYQDIAEPVRPDRLSFGAFADQGDNGTNPDLGGFFQEPFEAGGILDRGDGDRDVVCTRRLGGAGFYGDPAFLLVVIEDHGIKQGSFSVG